jgi:hypothetical protein
VPGVRRQRTTLLGLLHHLWSEANTPKYGKKWTHELPIKSSHSLGMGCPFLSTVDGQNECQMSIVFWSANAVRRLAS